MGANNKAMAAFQLSIPDGNAQSLIIQTTTNLSSNSWVNLSTNPVLSGQVIFTDTNASQYGSRFYRAVSQP
jgi:hypothetical protein